MRPQMFRNVRLFGLSLVLLVPALSARALDANVLIENRTFLSSEGVVFEAATNTVTAGTNVIVESGANVTFVAGQSVVLRPGFTVRKGATFTSALGDMGGHTVVGEEDWSGTRYLAGTVSVPIGAILDIAEGSRLVFLPGGLMVVEGNLVATGVHFTSTVQRPDSSNSWNGIVVVGPAVFLNSRIEYARQGIRVEGAGTLHVEGTTFFNNLIGLHVFSFATTPRVSRSVFDSNVWYGAKEDATGDMRVTNTVFRDNGNLYYELTETLLTIDGLNNQAGNAGNIEE